MNSQQRRLLFGSVRRPDTAGWTQFTRSADTRIVYCSSSTGNDGTGVAGDIGHPYATVNAAVAQLRDGFPDWLLFKKGDTWTTGLSRIELHGRSSTQPMLISSYGTGARPLFKSPVNDQGVLFIGGGQDGDNVALVGIEFYSYQRNPNDPGFNQAAAVLGEASGIMILNQVSWFLVEDCKVSFFVDNLNIQAVDHSIFRRNVIVDSWSVEPVHAQGGYFDNILQLELIENLFDHNGWMAGETYQVRNVFNHNWYIQNNQRGPVNLQGNYTARDNAGGQCRVGGVINANMAIEGMEMTNIFNTYVSTVTNNVITELINQLGLGDALRVADDLTSTAAQTYTGNIIVHGIDNPMTGTFLFQDTPDNVTVTSNIFYDWKCTAPGWFGSPGAGSSLTGNDIDLNGTNNNPGGAAPSEPFPHPERTVASYAASIGISPATNDGYLTACRAQSKDNWNPRLESRAIINYFRNGFGLALI